MRIAFTIALLMAPSLALADALECRVITDYVKSIVATHVHALEAEKQSVQGVKDAINRILVDPRMPPDLVTDARQQIFGEAFDTWEKRFVDTKLATYLPEDPLFDAMMQDKCGGN